MSAPSFPYSTISNYSSTNIALPECARPSHRQEQHTFSGQQHASQQPAGPTGQAVPAVVDGPSDDSWFWETEMLWILKNGEGVNGPVRDIYTQYPELQQQISEFYDIVFSVASTEPVGQSERITPEADIFSDLFDFDTAGGETTSAGTAASSAMKFNGGDAHNLHAAGPFDSSSTETAGFTDVNGTGDGSGRNATLAKSSTTTPSSNNAIKVEPYSPKAQESGTHVAQLGALTTSQQAAPQPSVPLQPMRSSASLTPQLPPNSPQYIDDIPDAHQARDIIAHPDPADCQKLQISEDDVDEVKSNQHYYAKQFFDALMMVGTQAPHSDRTTEEVVVKFQDQQRTSYQKIVGQMDTETQLKQARARCLLAVDAAISVHDRGIPRLLFGNALASSSRSRSDRNSHADLNSRCSERLGNMVRMVRDFKLVALDLLTGKGMHKLAYDADWYAHEKFLYLVSNMKRQKNAEIVQKTTGLGPKTLGKRERDDDDVGRGETKRYRG